MAGMDSAIAGEMGTVTLVSGGPGDPGLVTVAGLDALMAADVVVTDRLAPLDLLDRLPDGVEVIDVAKHPRGHFTPQEAINQLLIDRARAGHQVVRFKGGDGYVFGRGHEEVQACNAAGVPVRVIPGVSSVTSVPALAGIPVTHRGLVHDFTVASGHIPPGHPDSLTNWSALGASTGTLVLLMAVANAGAIADALIAAGRAATTPAAIIRDGSLASQEVLRTTLAELGSTVVDRDVRPPAVLVIGDVVGLT